MKQIFCSPWIRIPRKIKKKSPKLFRELLEEKRSMELQELGYEYILIHDFFKMYTGAMDYNSVLKSYEKWEIENDHYYSSEYR